MSTYSFGRFKLNVGQLLLTYDENPVALGPKVVETLLALIEHPGEVLSKQSLMERVWPDGFVEESNLAQNIHVLRKTFRSHGQPDPIETIPRRGYRFIAAVAHGPVLGRAQLSNLGEFRPTLHKGSAFAPAFLRRLAGASVAIAFVAASVVLAANGGFSHHAASTRPLSGIAAQQYQIGRYYWNLRTRDGVQKSIGYFSRVVDLDPTDARGYAGLADANTTMGEYCYGTHRPDVYYARARAYAEKALALDPNSAEAHASLGVLALERKDHALAREELRHALVLDPAYGPAQEWYGIALLNDGQRSEGVSHLKLAADLDPLSVATIAWLGSAAFSERRFGDAITYSRQALELSPQRVDALATIGEAYEAQGDFNGAIAAFKRFGNSNEFYRPEAAALLARVYALVHRGEEARAQLDYAIAHASHVDPADLAAAAAALGARNDLVPAGPAHAHAIRTSMFA